MAIAHFYIVVARGDAKISWANDLAVLAQLFETMCTPATDASDGEKRCVEPFRQVEHIIYKAAVIVDIGADPFVDLALFGNHTAGDFLNLHIKIAFCFASLFFGKLTYKLTQHRGAGIALGVDSVAHAIDEARTVEGALVQNGFEVFGNGFVIGPIGDAAFEIVEHMVHTNVGAAVTRSLEPSKGRWQWLNTYRYQWR